MKFKYEWEPPFIKTEDYLEDGLEGPLKESKEFIEQKKNFYALDLRQGLVEEFEMLPGEEESKNPYYRFNVSVGP